ncbi:MAG: D-2-hydroxyacid dehydrogenase [Bryobacteraceae bacterium]|nr:D-2-hydroxyacid dehydrogenase [Bryobacteraceae bacterium]
MIRLFPLILLAVALLPAQATKKVVILPNAIHGAAITDSELAEFRKAAPSLNIVTPPADRAEQEARDAHAIIGAASQSMVAAAKNLEWLQVPSAGVEQYLTPAFKARSFTFTNGKIVQGPEIADHALALLLAHTRGLTRYMRQRDWSGRTGVPLLELRGKNAVVIGAGGIGTQIAIRAHAFGMNVTGVDVEDKPLLPFFDRIVRVERLDEVLPQADVVFMAAPHTPASEKMMGAKQFDLMRKTAYFIAISRGKTFDNAALLRALSEGRLAGAGLDVTEVEPLAADSPLWKMDNVVITPHIAGRSDGERARYIDLYRENLQRFAQGLPLRHQVDKQKGY